MNPGWVILILGIIVVFVYGVLIGIVYVSGCTNAVTGYYNKWIEYCTPDSSHLTPILPLSMFPEHRILEQHTDVIAQEIKTFLHNYRAPSANESSSITFGDSFSDDGWKLVILKFYNKNYPQIQSHFPKTMQCLNQCGDKVRIAMFSILLPHHRIAPHVGPFRGSMRYHLGLDIPIDRQNCFIEIHGHKYEWMNGGSLLFDDTYVHQVYNNTKERRIILFLDIQRPDYSLTPRMAWVNNIICNSFLIHSLSQLNDKNEIPEKIITQ
jgi:aspartyl/asparaginyl beta-hydroxylase (cupin superfamily)